MFIQTNNGIINSDEIICIIFHENTQCWMVDFKNGKTATMNGDEKSYENFRDVVFAATSKFIELENHLHIRKDHIISFETLPDNKCSIEYQNADGGKQTVVCEFTTQEKLKYMIDTLLRL